MLQSHLQSTKNIRPGRLVARTLPFQGGEAGSEPVRATIYFQLGYFLVDRCCKTLYKCVYKATKEAFCSLTLLILDRLS